MTHLRFYTSQDTDAPDSTWSVYSEQYDDLDAPPIDGTQRHVSVHPDRECADAVANWHTRRQIEAEAKRARPAEPSPIERHGTDGHLYSPPSPGLVASAPEGTINPRKCGECGQDWNAHHAPAWMVEESGHVLQWRGSVELDPFGTAWVSGTYEVADIEGKDQVLTCVECLRSYNMTGKVEWA